MIYWLIFVAWILYSYFARKGSQYHLWIAFILFLISALLKIVSFNEIAQPIMAVSLLGWFIGITLALRDYRRN